MGFGEMDGKWEAEAKRKVENWRRCQCGTSASAADADLLRHAAIRPAPHVFS